LPASDPASPPLRIADDSGTAIVSTQGGDLKDYSHPAGSHSFFGRLTNSGSATLVAMLTRKRLADSAHEKVLSRISWRRPVTRNSRGRTEFDSTAPIPTCNRNSVICFELRYAPSFVVRGQGVIFSPHRHHVRCASDESGTSGLQQEADGRNRLCGVRQRVGSTMNQ
jgi:hypothetical protein